MTINSCFLFLFLFSCAVPFAGADERMDLYREMKPLKEEYRKRISKITLAGHDELKAEHMKTIKAMAAVGKATESHPELAEQREARDEAKKIYDEARKGDDQELIRKTARAYQDAAGKVSRDAFQLEDIKALHAKSVAQRRKVDALKYRLVAESDEEGKALIEKLQKLEARYKELTTEKKE